MQHTPARELPLGPGTWRTIERFAGARGRHRIARSGVIDTPAGTPVYVVVLEPTSDPLPPAAAVRLRYPMTRREAEVALLLARRLSGPEIAEQLQLSIHTTRRHTEQVLAKMGVSNRLAVRSALAQLAESAAASDQPNPSPGDRGNGAGWQAPSVPRLRRDSFSGRLAG